MTCMTLFLELGVSMATIYFGMVFQIMIFPLKSEDSLLSCSLRYIFRSLYNV